MNCMVCVCLILNLGVAGLILGNGVESRGFRVEETCGQSEVQRLYFIV